MQTLAEGAMIGYTPRGMQLAQETIVIFCSLQFQFCCIVLTGFKILKFYINNILQEKMISRNFFLNARLGTDLLLAAAGETVTNTNSYPLTTKYECMNCFSILA
jgi:hypothetical protein